MCDLDFYQSAVFFLQVVDLALTESGNAYKARKKRREKKNQDWLKA